MSESNRILPDHEIESALNDYGWNCDVDEGRLMALELLSKAAKGAYNSHTEERFLSQLKLMTKTRKPNKRGFEFICSMVYKSSCKRPRCFDAMKKYRV